MLIACQLISSEVSSIHGNANIDGNADIHGNAQGFNFFGGVSAEMQIYINLPPEVLIPAIQANFGQ